MAPTAFSTRLGDNIRRIRKLRGLTAAELSQKLDITPDELRKYERGERTLSVERMITFASALDCSVQNLLEGLDSRSGGMLPSSNLIRMMTPDEHRIMHYMATDWDGDVRALIIACGIYMVLPPRRRREAMMAMDVIKDEALLANEISPADLPEDMEYFQRALGALYNIIR